MLAVAFDAGEAEAGQVHGFRHRQVFFERFAHFAQVLGVQRDLGDRPTTCPGRPQLLARLGLLQKAFAVVLGQRSKEESIN